MKAFTKLYDELDSTTSTNEKITALKKYFTNAPADDAMWAVLILTSRISKRVLTSRSLRESFLRITKYSNWLYEESYSQVGDTAETLSLLLQSLDLARHESIAPGETSDKSLSNWLEVDIPELAKIKDEDQRAEKLLSFWKELTPLEIFILNKLMTGGFRVGVSEKSVVRALSEVFNLETDQVSHRLTGATDPGAENFKRLISKEKLESLPSQPYPFCLAYAWSERTEKDWDSQRWCIEWKYDGIRSQIIRRAGAIWIWSRGEDDISVSFPDIAELFAALPDGTVLDGEIVIIKDDQIQSFQELQKRLGRKKVSALTLKNTPAAFIAYDCLETGHEDIRQISLRERKQILEKLMTPLLSKKIRLSPTLNAENPEQVEDLRALSREKQAEGVMIKDWSSSYPVGRKTGYWWKNKVDPLTLDAVLLYAQAGTGRRANLYTDYTFALWSENKELIPFAKAYSGLDQDEINQLDYWIRRHTKEKFGPVRSLEPFHVFEIGFEGIAASNRHKSGIAVRFPRILRWRKDKKFDEADHLTTAFKLLDGTP
ncbi:MAG: ATP-dependent DNA ligase [Bdellovibrio sp.]|nr:ATP-dependent DNA ligase [Bdellovibrio sp.]